MARYLLIEISDNDDADAFVEALRVQNILFGKKSQAEEGELSWNHLEGAKPSAMWGKPTLFCECPDSVGSAKTAKMGWYVHPACARPRKGQHQTPKDLLHPELEPQQRPFYLHFYADGRGFQIPKERK